MNGVIAADAGAGGKHAVQQFTRPGAPASNFVSYGGYLLVACIAAVFFTTILPASRVFPYADEWEYARPLNFTSFTEFMAWAFGQHVDHRIPIQKFLHFPVLWLTGFDFRYLLAVNFCLAIAESLMLMKAARLYRGSQALGDLLIPLVALNFAAGFTQWAFEFQFLSSTLFASGFLLFCMLYARREAVATLNAALACALLAAFCGVNGMIMSSVLAISTLMYFTLHSRAGGARWAVSSRLLLAACLAANALLWLSWKPTGATDLSQFVEADILEYAFRLLASGFMVYAFDGAWWKPALVLAMCAGAAGVLFRRLHARVFSFGDFSLAAVLFASCAEIMSVALGRAAHFGRWDQGIGMHYGYLTILLAITSWVIVSPVLRGKILWITGLILLAVFARAFQVNAEWRYQVIESSRLHLSEVTERLTHEEDIAKLVPKYILDFNWRDSSYDREVVESGIRGLRKIHAPIYGPPGNN